MTEPLRASSRTTVRRHSERGSHDRAAVDAVLEEAYVAHVGYVVDGAPRVLPMTYGCVGDRLYLHGAVGNAMLKGSDGAQVCVTVTLLDGLVLARSAFHHSMNYRSVVLLGRAQRVTDEAEKRVAFDAFVEKAILGRASVARPADADELRSTLVLSLDIHEGSMKVRTGPPVDEPEDMSVAAWAGVVPLRLTPGPPERDPAQRSSEAGAVPVPRR